MCFTFQTHVSVLHISDVDECLSEGVNQCHEMAECENSVGNYTCTCQPGYTGDGFHCQCKSQVSKTKRNNKNRIYDKVLTDMVIDVQTPLIPCGNHPMKVPVV